MSPVFADSSYLIAFVSIRDADHEAAVRWGRSNLRPLVSTEFILVEVADFLCSVQRRSAFRVLWESLLADRTARILPASPELFRAGMKLYLARPDKEWSLTDCISFVVMEREGLTDALTADHHFEQAGFNALLK